MNYRTALATASFAVWGMTAMPAAAQNGESAIRGQLRACSQIADVPARMACYEALAADVAAAPVTHAVPQPLGIGSEQVPRARASEPTRAPQQAEIDSIEATVTAAVQREPGIHLLTLEDGAQWQFVEGVSLAYDPPRPGSSVEIRSASMGSYQMRYRGQPAVRVRRVR